MASRLQVAPRLQRKETIHVFSVNVDASSPSPAQEKSHSPDSPNALSALNAKQTSSWYFFSGTTPLLSSSMFRAKNVDVKMDIW
jgi:hypothetical protein